MRVRFTGGPIVLAETVIEDGSVTAEDGIIVAIGEDGRTKDVEFDLAGRSLMPGLVDLHGDAI
ncbi:MAG: hypothetical protein GEV13_35860 [Rhodospirillales bacterium]|nr:hypothetical protein [Rhodospirillales bacterium]